MAKRLFISYSHADAAFVERLHKHLAQLQREGSVSGWFDREIRAGGRIDSEIERELSEADIFLACVSADYIASNYCFERELTAALDLEEQRKMAIVPVIFEPCDWLSTPLQRFKALPDDGKPISEFTNPNVAFLDVVTGLRRLATIRSSENGAGSRQSTEEPLSSRYRAKREFDQLHKRDFVESSFVEIYKFFEASAAEVSGIPDIEARLSPLGTDHFSCTMINRGISRGFETIHVRRGGNWGVINGAYIRV